MSEKLTRYLIDISGIVQGVGFRPFVYKLAYSCCINGWVNNFSGGVHIDAEGTNENLKVFIRRLKEEAPPLSYIDSFRKKIAEPVAYLNFEIRKSSSENAKAAFISPDISVCEDCLKEMSNPDNRRYRYPFINCTNCGPRFTITAGIPYDRINTTMHSFPMCEDCAEEYHDPSDRRFHAQPIACRKCGPSLSLLDSEGNQISGGSEIEKTIELLKEGMIVAIKGLGGYHLACDAENDEAVAELRKRKNRDGKPFALMAKDIDVVLKYCFVNEKESEILQKENKPIVLLDRKPRIDLAVNALSPDNDKLGIMLPYTPLHYLLFGDNLELLVMTSGNRSGEPIYYKDNDAIQGLSGIADYFLSNSREIYIRTDDSVTGVFRDKECIIRRSRGYVPYPIDISSVLENQDCVNDCIPSVLSCGGELKNTFCITKGTKAFISHHIGDLENIETLTSFESGIAHFESIFSVTPEVAASDKHPDYLSTKYADSLLDMAKIQIQHHHAHIAACMAENGVSGPVIGVAFDGTGYGDDGRIWGGEFFTGDYSGFERRAHFEYVPLPGNDAAIKEPWRMAVSYLVKTFGEDLNRLKLPFISEIGADRVDIVTQQILKGINSPDTSSVGRLFDAVSALVGLCNTIEYEGQAAIRLEKSAETAGDFSYKYAIERIGLVYRINVRQMISAIVEDVLNGKNVSNISGAFHRTVAQIMLNVCQMLRDESGLNQVVLSGGVFQNRCLLGLALDLLENDGFHVYIHSKVPTNDGGISLGQAAIALRKTCGGKL